MESITLKEIAGYLPFYLDILPIKRPYMYGHYEEKKMTIWVLNRFNLEDIKPLLYPLSMLTQPINHNGKEIIPIEEIDSLAESVSYYSIDFYIRSTKFLPFWVIEKLYEWHFDVHGLIPRGLAIDKSKVNL